MIVLVITLPSYWLSLKIKDVIPKDTSERGFKRKTDNYSNVFEVFSSKRWISHKR